jgi:hypothetical protein
MASGGVERLEPPIIENEKLLRHHNDQRLAMGSPAGPPS